jgi:hypothetical protein
MLISQNRKQLVLNSALELGEDLTVEKKGKGRKFVSRFIEAGLAHYQEFGDILITKETLDKFIHTMVGCPLIINHKEITDKNADKERVGVISNVWFNDMDGWYYCDGIIWDLQAIDLVKNQGWSVSCTYDFVSDNLEKTHNGKKISMEFIDGEFLHLALVNNPRYERANIVINSKDEVNNAYLKSEDIAEWITTESGAHIPIAKGMSKKEGLKHFAKLSHENRKQKNKRKDEAYSVIAEAIGKDKDYVKKHFKSDKVQELIEKAKTDDSLSQKASFDKLEHFNQKELEEADTNTQEKWINQALDIIEGKSSDKSDYDKFQDEYGEYLKDLEEKQQKIIKDSKGDIEKAEKELAKLYGVEDLEYLNEEQLNSFYNELNKYYEQNAPSEEKREKENVSPKVPKDYKDNVSHYSKDEHRKEIISLYKNIEENKNISEGRKKEDIEKIKYHLKIYEKYPDTSNIQFYGDDRTSEEQKVKEIKKWIIKSTKNNKAQNGKDTILMTVLKDLEKFIKGIVDNACDKDEKVENEDKRKIIDEVGGILKDKVDEEVWRTVIGKLEKVAYEPSETDKADNKCKNEDDEDEEEKEEKFEEEKEIAENKDKEDKEEDKKEEKADNKCAKNSMDDVKRAIMGGNVKTKTVSSYVSQSDRLKAGEKY